MKRTLLLKSTTKTQSAAHEFAKVGLSSDSDVEWSVVFLDWLLVLNINFLEYGFIYQKERAKN